MRPIKLLLLATTMISGAAMAASDKVAIGPAPDWVKPVAIPPLPDGGEDAPVRILLADQQSRLEPGRETSYVDMALQIQTPQGLAAGNLSIPWNPQTDELTVHKLIIHRDGEDIDVLAAGQSFTVVRREPNLESATLDGVFTANIQPEGLQVGDILEYAMTISSSDPVFQGHVELSGAGWNALPFARTHLSVAWPSSMAVQVRPVGALPPIKPVKAKGMTQVELSLDNVEPVIPPRGAPLRYAMGRMIEFSDFRSWADVGALMAPLYETAGKVPAEGPLRNELEKIKAASTDPVQRAEAALALVQDRVRYVALLMGTGGYVPAAAEETWGRRYGDCKAKSALLLALLHELGIEAEPVAANIQAGDGIDERLPMVGLFNHVLVRAHIGGKDYWLDGTRSGDTSLARLQIPNMDWGLPLVAKDAALVRMVPAPLDKPGSDLAIEIDARDGISLPAPIKATMVLRGDAATGTRLSLASMAADARDRALRDYWRGQFNFVDVTKVDASFDKETGEERLTLEGKANMDWDDGWYEVDKSDVGFDADFTRTPGSGDDAPFTMGYPDYDRTVETILLPASFPDVAEVAKAHVDETVAGIEYKREAKLVDQVFRIERTIRTVAPEFPAGEASAAQKRLRELNDARVFLRRPDNYRMTSAEIEASLDEMPKTTQESFDRGNLLLGQGRYADAVVDLSDVLEKEPRHVMALADRGMALAGMGKYDAATRDLDAAEAIDPRNEYVFHGRGMIALGRGDFDSAVAAFSRALEIDPKDRYALEQRIQVNFSQENFDDALADIDTGLKLDPKWYGIMATRARILLITGKREEALEQAKVLAEADGGRAARSMAAQIYLLDGDNEKAVAAIGPMVDGSADPAAYLFRAALRAPHDFIGRESDIEAALAIAPDHPQALQAKATLQVEMGDFEHAIEGYSALLQNDPANPGLLNLRGIAFAKARDMIKAKRDFVKAREAASSSVVLNSICYEKATAGVALDQALDECDTALERAPDAAPILDSKAFVLLRLGRTKEAIDYYDRALAKAPNLAPSLFGRAIAHARAGDQDAAQADLQAALRLDGTIRARFESYGVTM